jgi:hypothetical protein
MFIRNEATESIVLEGKVDELGISRTAVFFAS